MASEPRMVNPLPQFATPGERRMLIAADAFHRRRVNVVAESITGPDPLRLGDVLREVVSRILARCPNLVRGAA